MVPGGDLEALVEQEPSRAVVRRSQSVAAVDLLRRGVEQRRDRLAALRDYHAANKGRLYRSLETRRARGCALFTTTLSAAASWVKRHEFLFFLAAFVLVLGIGIGLGGLARSAHTGHLPDGGLAAPIDGLSGAMQDLPPVTDDMRRPTQLALVTRDVGLDTAARMRSIWPWAALVAAANIAFAIAILSPAWFSYVAVRSPRDVVSLLAYGATIPIIALANWAVPGAFRRLDAATGVFPNVCRSANRLRRALPGLLSLVLAASALFIGPTTAPDPDPAHSSAPTFGPAAVFGNASLDATSSGGPLAVLKLDLPYYGFWNSAGSTPRTRPSSAFEVSPRGCRQGADPMTGCTPSGCRPALPSSLQQGASADKHKALVSQACDAASAGRVAGVPVFAAVLDSGCSASLTHKSSIVINKRPCDEVFGQANGHATQCESIGDMPVLMRDDAGRFVQLVFTNVRVVPAYKFTLLSVTQLWEEQHIDARFRDLNRLELPSSCGDRSIPYESSCRLSTLLCVSVAELNASKAGRSYLNSLPSAKPEPQPTPALAALGFHSPKSVAHIARLSASQAGELMHRRFHWGVDKIRAAADVLADAPSVLRSAPKIACVDCAVTKIKKVSHTGALHTPAPEPGVLHCDLKGPFPRGINGEQYAMLCIDEYTRMVFVEFLQFKSEAGEAAKRVIAKFEATVGTPVDDDGRPRERPRVRALRTDHEGALESRHFEAFRADAGIDATTSPPHDHDLNPIAERVIGVISELATASKLFCNAPIGFWPYVFRDAVEKHNHAAGSVGSSTADSQVCALQRFTLRQPSGMDLLTLGSRAVVLKPPPHQKKGDLTGRGWVGVLLGRGPSIGSYLVWANGRLVTSSSVLVDEENFPWWGDAASKPLLPASRPPKQPTDEPLGPGPRPAPPGESAQVPLSAINAPAAAPKLRFLDLFSGPYQRANGFAAAMRGLGWQGDQIDNDAEVGGGWSHALMNDEVYARIKQAAAAGTYDAIMIAFPCSTFSASRFFDASARDPTKQPGPPPVRTLDYPDGLPPDQIDPLHIKELNYSNRLLDRAVDVAITARASQRSTSIALENPSLRSKVGTTPYASDLENHSSIFCTTAFDRLRSSIGPSSTCTFAYCRLGGDFQKYTTLFYTNDMAPVLDKLNGPDFQCNHRPGTHRKVAGGYLPSGRWSTEEAAPYPTTLCARLAEAFTVGRTGSSRPFAPPSEAPGPTTTSPVAPQTQPLTDAREQAEPRPAAPATVQPPAPTPRGTPAVPVRARFADSPAAAETAADLDAALRDAASLQPAAADRPTPDEPPDEVQGRAGRSVRSSTRSDTNHSLARAGGDRLGNDQYEDTGPQHAAIEGAGLHSLGLLAENSTAADVMEATVASLVIEASFPEFAAPDCVPILSGAVPVQPDNASLTVDRVPRCATQTSGDTWVLDDEHLVGPDRDELRLALRASLLSAGLRGPLATAIYAPMFHALRADSEGAPANVREAKARGGWDEPMAKELRNHSDNESWERISANEVPKGRRLHKLTWVFKVKRDGTLKARLCVQGCTLEQGVDFDQVFSSTLRYSSARALFALAARSRCKVRSVDWVAAYLQGSFQDGEVVYCRMPPGFEENDANGVPYALRIVKPIYGIPQSGRRLQRCVFPWLRDAMGLRPLDDSDTCVWVYDAPKKGSDQATPPETFAIGVYVDNLQIVHSAELDADGNAVDPDSYYAKFMAALRSRWDVVDEGEMEDLLAIQARTNANGSITLHQEKYIDKLLERFAPERMTRVQANSTPYSPEIQRHVREATDSSPGGGPTPPPYPELVRPFQERCGALMYLCNSTRPDMAYTTHLLCRAMQRPTPALMTEVDIALNYIERTRSLGITYSPARSELHGLSDASWETRHSTSGWVIFWQRAPISWGSRRQHSIALSSCESELMALSEAAKDMVYFRKLIGGLDASFISGPTALGTDNTGARNLSYNPEHHDRSKHIERRHFYVRDMVEKMEISVPFVPTELNVADIFTKPLKPKRFVQLRRALMGETGAASPPVSGE